MTVGSTAGFAETGVLVVDKEVISYSRKTPTAFLGLSRGYARMHADGAPAVVGGCICDANHRRSSSLCRPFALRHGSNCVVNAGITPVTSSASTASAPLMEPLALAAELARYDIVFTTYTALTVQERLAASCCAVWGALYPPYQQSYAGVSCSFRTDSVASNRPRRVPGGAAVAPHVKIAFLPCQAADRNQSAK